MSKPKITLNILAVMLELSKGWSYPFELIKATGIPGGTMHPLLDRLEGWGLVESERENINPKLEGRPARHWYWVTDLGRKTLAETLADLGLQEAERKGSHEHRQ